MKMASNWFLGWEVLYLLLKELLVQQLLRNDNLPPLGTPLS